MHIKNSGDNLHKNAFNCNRKDPQKTHGFKHALKRFIRDFVSQWNVHGIFFPPASLSPRNIPQTACHHPVSGAIFHAAHPRDDNV